MCNHTEASWHLLPDKSHPNYYQVSQALFMQMLSIMSEEELSPIYRAVITWRAKQYWDEVQEKMIDDAAREIADDIDQQILLELIGIIRDE